jgi:NADPH:quinone reductase-like Zn-dependent oxidoreductase
MQAMTRDRYGSPDVLKLENVKTPIPGEKQVLLRVHAASINPYDWHFLRGMPLIARPTASGLMKPKHRILGSDAAGTVEAVGAGATRFRAGDEVYGLVENGGLAEYLTVAEDQLALKPRNLTFDQAAAVPLAGTTALQGLRDAGHLEPCQRVMIIGASGGVGSFAVQIARAFGAQVTGVCSTGNVELVRSLGAEHVIDYTREDLTQDTERYDLVFQLAGMHSAAALRRVLTPHGTLVLSSGDSTDQVLGPLGRILGAVLLNSFVSQNLRTFLAKPSAQDLKTLADLIESDKVTPVIERTYPLAEAAEAMRHVETGHTRGKVVITI